MRFYSISITPPSGQSSSTGQQSTVANIPTVVTPTYPANFGFANLASGNAGGPTYASFLNGSVIPNAWDIELDIPVGAFGSPGQGGAWVRIWGISLQEIAQSTQLQGNLLTSPTLNGYGVQISGGMGPGLPLATSEVSQQGVLVQGQVLQAFGNWIGTDMTLEMVISAAIGNSSGPLNFTLNWPPGTPLSQALQTTFQNAYSGSLALPSQPTINISPNLVQQDNVTAQFPDINALGSFVKQTSKRIINTSGYYGVTIAPSGGTFNIFDGNTPASSSSAPGSSSTQPTMIQFQDMIGQPTWTGYNQMQIKTVMRGDLKLGGQIMLPPGTLVTSTPTPGSQYNSGLAFQGSFMISKMRHIGHSRQPDAASWVTVINAVAQPQSSPSSQQENPAQGSY